MMRARAALVMVLVVACGGGGKATGTGDGTTVTGAGEESRSGTGTGTGTGSEAATGAKPIAAPAGFAEADAITIDGGDVVTWSFAGGKVAELGRATLAKVDPEDYMAALDGDWADRDHFFVHVPPRDVFVVTAAGITPVTVPPESAFKAPRPKVDDDEGLNEGGVMDGRDTGLVVTKDHEAWWSECPWGFPYDGWQCEIYVSARLWPTAKTMTDQTGVGPRSFDWAGAKVSGFRTKELDEGRELGCTPPAGTRYKQTRLGGKSEDGEMVYATEWVSASPPRLLLIWGSPGYADLVPTRWELHDGCLEKPVLHGEWATPGPAPYWLGDTTIYKGGDALGPITGNVRFRPPT
ncbi:MAG TPA: hypothetical protein VM261_38715 [Kofleriaceae bacterium]|nr:hypothetical protein [Kofleriaceae bacterium]